MQKAWFWGGAPMGPLAAHLSQRIWCPWGERALDVVHSTKMPMAVTLGCVYDILQVMPGVRQY